MSGSRCVSGFACRSSAVLNDGTNDLLHPDGERVNASAEVVTYRRATIRIANDRGQPLQNRRRIRLQEILEPVEGLHDSHRWVTGPVEPARRNRFELNLLITKLNRPQASIGEDRHASGHGGCETEIIGCRETVHHDARLVPAHDGVDYSLLIRLCWLSG